MDETTVGREPIQIVEILQPKCTNTFGVAPCTATGTADTKCYNTRASCQSAANYALGTPLSLYFSKGAGAEYRVTGADYVIPSLVSVSTTPTQINLAGANPDASGIGNRAVCTITFRDHPHTDRIVDPYQSGRSWDALTADRGSFWTRWLARNKYRQNIQISIYEGYSGQALSAMKKRTFFLQSLTGPDSNGKVTIQGKDALARIEERKAQAPVASPGKLYADITNSATSFEVANAATTDYPAPGTVRIGDEIMTYSAVSATAHGVTLTITSRATDNTVAATHSANDTVQLCWRVTDQAVNTVLNTLLATYGGISAGWLDTTGWASEVASYMAAYRLNALITEPTAVVDLVAEIQVQTLCYVWWDERASLIKLRAVRGVDSDPATLTEEKNIIADSFSLAEMPKQRASQVWVYYLRNNFVKSVTDPKAYAQASIVANLASEGATQYGEPSIRKVFARWLSSGALADSTASRLSARYVDIPQACTFNMDAKDRGYWVGDTVKISHHLDVDTYGSRRVQTWTIVSAEEIIPGEVVRYVAENTTLYGKIYSVMAGGSANYPGTLAPFKSAYIGASTGLLSDGSACARIA